MQVYEGKIASLEEQNKLLQQQYKKKKEQYEHLLALKSKFEDVSVSDADDEVIDKTILKQIAESRKEVHETNGQRQKTPPKDAEKPLTFKTSDIKAKAKGSKRYDEDEHHRPNVREEPKIDTEVSQDIQTTHLFGTKSDMGAKSDKTPSNPFLTEEKPPKKVSLKEQEAEPKKETQAKEISKTESDEAPPKSGNHIKTEKEQKPIEIGNPFQSSSKTETTKTGASGDWTTSTKDESQNVELNKSEEGFKFPPAGNKTTPNFMAPSQNYLKNMKNQHHPPHKANPLAKFPTPANLQKESHESNFLLF